MCAEGYQGMHDINSSMMIQVMCVVCVRLATMRMKKNVANAPHGAIISCHLLVVLHVLWLHVHICTASDHNVMTDSALSECWLTSGNVRIYV